MSRNYKFHNPVKEGLVFHAEDYPYSSALLADVVVIQ